MKEPAGEANMTVIVIVLIGVVASVGLLIIPKLVNRVKSRSCCHKVGGYISKCPESDRRGKLCCWWMSGEANQSALNSQYYSCVSITN